MTSSGKIIYPPMTLNRGLEIWTKMSTHVRMRDRSVKVIQYGCQMLIGYYSRVGTLSGEGKDILANARRTASTARKAFWILKSLNHISDIKKMFDKNVLTSSSTMDKLAMIEQVFLAIYYWYETLVFFIRVKFIKLEEDELDFGCNLSWFGGDLAFFATSSIQLYETIKKRREIVDAISLLHNSPQRPAGGDSFDALQAERLKLNTELYRNWLSFVISVLELGVSAHYAKVIKLLTGRDLGDGPVGFMGVASSLLILYEGLLKASAETMDS
jgi:Peroxisomal biogenesis factor 11 (PEX11)